MSISLPKLLITGGEGQLSQAILHHKDAGKFELISLSHSALDISNPDNVKQIIEIYSPAIVINTAAYTAVDKAESDTEAAMRVNYQGALNLAKTCDQLSIPLIHLSTDYVFDGTKNEAYTEKDIPRPLNQYGLSKLKGEEAIRAYCKKHLILRVSGIFSEYGNNFAKTILRLANEHKEFRVVNDQVTCPTYAGDIAGVIFKIAQDATPIFTFGTYHFCGDEQLSWYQFAVKLIGGRSIIKPVPSKDYLTAAKRPSFSVLNSNKILSDYQIKTSSLNEGIRHVIQKSTIK